MLFESLYTPQAAAERILNKPLPIPIEPLKPWDRETLNGYISECIDSLDVVVDMMAHDKHNGAYDLLQKHYNLQWLQYDLSLSEQDDVEEFGERFTELTGIVNESPKSSVLNKVLMAKVNKMRDSLVGAKSSHEIDRLRIYLIRAMRDVQLEIKLAEDDKLSDQSVGNYSVLLSTAITNLLTELRDYTNADIVKLTNRFLALDAGAEYTSGQVLRSYLDRTFNTTE